MLVNLKNKIPRNVFILGLVSFFNDLSSEIIYPIVPIFLTTVLKVSVPVVGLIEGIAEATSSISKFAFGALSDYFQKRKAFVILGYSFASVSKILIAMASTWPFVLFARFIDRVGKGLRTAPRDSLLLQSSDGTNTGFIFGFHRAFDSLGAVFGPLAGLALLQLLSGDMRKTFFVAAIPSFIAVLLIILFLKESRAKTTTERYKVKLSWKGLNRKLKLFLVISFLFALGNSSDAFIILKAKSLGFTTTLTILSYVLYNVVQSAFATPAGRISDKIGPKKVFASGLLVFSAVYLFFGLIKNPSWLWILFPLYGLYIAFTDGVSKAYVSEFVKKEESGTYFGAYYTLMAVGGFLASFVGGLLWAKINPSATFYYGSVMALLAFLVFMFAQKDKITT